jgi:hypothetical protein
VDIIHDHNLVEVKGGLVSNTKGAEQWRLTIGQPGKDETREMRKLSKSKLAEYNKHKQDLIPKRKQAILKAYKTATGKTIEAKTMTVILHPDKNLADIYAFKGWHQRIGWKNPIVEKAYVATVKFKIKTP